MQLKSRPLDSCNAMEVSRALDRGISSKRNSKTANILDKIILKKRNMMGEWGTRAS